MQPYNGIHSDSVTSLKLMTVEYGSCQVRSSYQANIVLVVKHMHLVADRRSVLPFSLFVHTEIERIIPIEPGRGRQVRVTGHREDVHLSRDLIAQAHIAHRPSRFSAVMEHIEHI